MLPATHLETIGVYDNPAQANLFRARLESAGIAAYLFDEHMIGLNPLFSVTLGGIKLKVNHADAAEALQLLNGASAEAADDPVECPACGSINTDPHVKNANSAGAWWSMVLSLVTFTYPLHLDSRCLCRDCGYEFKFRKP